MSKEKQSSCRKYYQSPRWSGEILDCSMPVSFDSFSACSFNCLYCFSFNQKICTQGERPSGRRSKTNYQQEPSRPVNIEAVKKLFSLSGGDKSFHHYIRAKKVVQWGGLSDPFDENEREQGVSLELMRFFATLDYPLCFSTKGVFWLNDARYVELVRNRRWWNCKFSIINLNTRLSSKVEIGCPSPAKRLDAIEQYAALNAGGATLRLRPFIIGMTDRDGEYLDLIAEAHKRGATAVSTEFFCLEQRAVRQLKARYYKMSDAIGFDLWAFYRKHSSGQGYLRLNYNIKRPYIEKMAALCKKLGLRFYVSDAHHKEKCHNSSCCGLSEEWNYSRGTLTEALLLARKNGVVHFSDIAPHLDPYKDILVSCAARNVLGFFKPTARAKRFRQSVFDMFRETWNTPNQVRSPYKYFSGVLAPCGVDDEKNIVYKFDYEKAGIEEPAKK